MPPRRAYHVYSHRDYRRPSASSRARSTDSSLAVSWSLTSRTCSRCVRWRLPGLGGRGLRRRAYSSEMVGLLYDEITGCDGSRSMDAFIMPFIQLRSTTGSSRLKKCGRSVSCTILNP